jgi:prepilin-type processing-associated H-X9-DG protein
MIQQARKAQCLEQLKKIGAALLEYQVVHKHFPAAAITDGSGKRLLSWRVAILPQLGLQSLYDQFHLDESWDTPHNLALAALMPAIYACPALSARDASQTGYEVVVGPKPELGSIGTMFEWDRGVEIREVLDGLSNTVMVVETARSIIWTRPDDPTFHRDGPLPELGDSHPGGFHALFADGSARFLKNSIVAQILRSLMTRDGGEVLSSD